MAELINNTSHLADSDFIYALQRHVATLPCYHHHVSIVLYCLVHFYFIYYLAI